MIPFFIYDTATGRVLATAAYDERGDGAAARAVGLGAINALTEYAPGGVKTARPRMPGIAINKTIAIANGVDAATITPIPAGAQASIYKDTEPFARAVATINDGTLSVTFDAAGEYRIRVALFPNVEEVFSVRAT